ncbi:MAG: type II toxin-antitoxin system Phd/YefM family antitoxin [Nitrospirae bacterium]|nr:type II toxin-antitoxin system Phd/YefM family antitoxin [Nitrospirota bacterium]
MGGTRNTNMVSVKQLRPSLPRILARIDRRFERFIVTRRGQPVAVMLSVDDYEALLETLDILADPKARVGIRRGEADIRRGKTHPWKEIKASIGRV